MRFDRLELRRWLTETMVTQTQQNGGGPKKCSECCQILPNTVGVVWHETIRLIAVLHVILFPRIKAWVFISLMNQLKNHVAPC